MKYFLLLLSAAVPAASLPPMAVSPMRPLFRPLPPDRIRSMLPRSPKEQNRFDKRIAKYARLFRLDPRLIKAIMAVESSFDPDSVSKAGALGLMQVMPATGAGFGYGRNKLRTPDGSIKAGAHQLAWLFKYMYGDLLGIRKKGWIKSEKAPRWVQERVVLAYFAGHANVKRNQITPASRFYLRKVMSLYGAADALKTPAAEPIWLSP